LQGDVATERVPGFLKELAEPELVCFSPTLRYAAIHDDTFTPDQPCNSDRLLVYDSRGDHPVISLSQRGTFGPESYFLDKRSLVMLDFGLGASNSVDVFRLPEGKLTMSDRIHTFFWDRARISEDETTLAWYDTPANTQRTTCRVLDLRDPHAIRDRWEWPRDHLTKQLHSWLKGHGGVLPEFKAFDPQILRLSSDGKRFFGLFAFGCAKGDAPMVLDCLYFEANLSNGNLEYVCRLQDVFSGADKDFGYPRGRE
jgi:hypothetical protein